MILVKPIEYKFFNKNKYSNSTIGDSFLIEQY